MRSTIRADLLSEFISICHRKLADLEFLSVCQYIKTNQLL
jgi:hypothetical protein